MIPERLQHLLDECKWDEALTFFKECDMPLSDELSEKLAWCYSRTEKYSEAILIYDVLLQKQPKNAKWHYSRGYQFYAQKDYVTAVINFEKALEINPNYFVVRYRLAYAYLQIAGIERQWTKDVFWKAIQQLNDAHKIYQDYSKEEKENNNTTYADICTLHGKTIISSPKYLDKGIEYLKTSLSLKADNDTKYQLAKAYYTKKEYELALKELPQDGKLPYYVSELKSQIFADSGKIDEAIKILLNLLRIRKKDYIYQRLANYYLVLSCFEKAEEFALLAVQADKRNYKNYLVGGQIFKAEQQFKTAFSYFEQAREKKLISYNVDCTEALQEIDEIMKKTAGAPTDLITRQMLAVKENRKRKGSIKKYNEERGFGFIKDDESEREFFFHISQFERGKKPQDGTNVCFELEDSEKGECAIRIFII